MQLFQPVIGALAYKIMRESLMKKQTKKKVKAKRRKIGMSQMVINFAQDFISLGDTIEIRQSYLNAACVAWNISLLQEEARATAINHFLEQYHKLNPGSDDVDNVRMDIQQLIAEKLEMYPDEKRSIINAQIVNDERGKEKIIIISK
jgi:hypothetical protein